MAPILKEGEASAANTTAPTPAASHAKSPTEPAARPQPLPLEVPVTVNGARTVDGSAKREPFSETTLTVLVFPLGAVIRIATPLVPGQLVFLTNEKSKKEVVCQVIRSKSAGNTSGYVELQFTEPAPGFWGLQVPGASASTVAIRPSVPSAPSAPKPVEPASSFAANPDAPKPLVPPPAFLTPAKPALAPPRVPATTDPTALQSLVPTNSGPSLSVPPPPPVAAILEARAPQPGGSVAAAAPVPPVPPAPSLPPRSASTEVPPAPVVPPPAIPAPSLHDYSKEINALFVVPQAPASNTPPSAVPELKPKPAPSSSSASSEELKLQAACLQAQLSSLLFTETPAQPASAVPPVKPAIEPRVAEVEKKVLQIAHDRPELAFKTEPRPPLPVRNPTPAPLAVEEEVRIPSWLAPLSQNSESPVAEPPASGVVVSDSDGSERSPESNDTSAADGSPSSETSVFGGQLLGESVVQEDLAASTSSKKGLFLAIAATALLSIGGGAWYYQKYYSRTTTVAPARTASIPSSAAPTHVSELPPTRNDSTAGINMVNPAPLTSSPALSKSSKNPEAVASQAVFKPAAEPKNTEPTPRTAPAEAPKKPALDNLHLAAPVVNRGTASPLAAVALPSLQIDASTAGSDPLAAVEGIQHKELVAPRPVGGDVKTAQLLKSVAPVYPPLARAQRISGNVQIDAFIDASGNVASVKVISGPPVLHNSALEAVKQWKYSPALLDGQPTSMHLTVVVQFRTQ